MLLEGFVYDWDYSLMGFLKNRRSRAHVFAT